MIKRVLPELGRHPESPFPPVERALREPNGLLAFGGDLSVARLVHAYRQGIFPWFSAGEPILWWSPQPRCVFATAQMHVPNRLRRTLSKCRWEISADRNFSAVLDACAAPRAKKGASTWITPQMRDAYIDLHRHGHAHSIEVRDGYRLIGGLYGVGIGRAFFAESMFSREDHGSKAALLGLGMVMRAWGFPLIDAQVPSGHLFTMGAQLMTREDFAAILPRVTAGGHPPGHWRERFPRFPASMVADRRDIEPDDFASRD